MRGVPRARRDRAHALFVVINAEQFRRALNDARQFGGAVKLQALHDAEALAQRRSQQARAGGRADQRERRQAEFDRPRGGSLADDDVQLIVLHRRIENFLNGRIEAVDFIDEQHVAALKVGQDGGQVAGLLQHRARSLPHARAHFIGENVRERGFAEPRRAKHQRMVKRLFAP